MSQHLKKNNSNGTGLAKAFPVRTFTSQLIGGSKDQNRNNKNCGSSANLRGGKMATRCEGRGRGQKRVWERETEGKQRVESPPFTRRSVLARFPRNVHLSAVYVEDFFNLRLLLTAAWIQLLFDWKEHRIDVVSVTGPQYLKIKADVYVIHFVGKFRHSEKLLEKQLEQPKNLANLNPGKAKGGIHLSL